MKWLCSLIAFFALGILIGYGQTKDAEAGIQGPDSLFIHIFARTNIFRVNYLSQRYSLKYGSTEEAKTEGPKVFTNTSDLLGLGLTYKIIDFDIAFSLPNTRILETGTQNLTQFRLSGSYTGRKFAIRGYWLESSSVVVADAQGQFMSSPSVHLLNLGIQYTYYFNHPRYSFKASVFQEEMQKKSAGSFLLRLEPFFRRLGVGTPIVPAALDNAATYGEQAGLQYVYAPGILLQPGYGYNWTTRDGRIFVCPMVFVGTGFAVNKYRGDTGEKASVNAEWKGAASLNLGYSSPRFFVAVRTSYEVNYFKLVPSYFVAADLKLGITAGYRFEALEKLLPTSLF